MPRTSRHTLHWNPATVAKIMADNDIGSRHALSKRVTMCRAQVYEAFDADWSGRATDKMIAQLIAHFDADFSDLILKPGAARKTGRKSSKS